MGRCLKAKYGCGEGVLPSVEKRNASHIWSNIVKIWDVFLIGVRRKVSNGALTYSWWDRWSGLEEPLISYVDRNELLVNPQALVKDFITEFGDWDFRAWEHFIPLWIIQKLRLNSLPSSPNNDVFSWRNSRVGNFSVKAAYRFLKNLARDDLTPSWKRIWKWPVSEKIKYFLWLVLLNSLPIN